MQNDVFTNLDQTNQKFLEALVVVGFAFSVGKVNYRLKHRKYQLNTVKALKKCSKRN
jgi:hypothetical protein